MVTKGIQRGAIVTKGTQGGALWLLRVYREVPSLLKGHMEVHRR